ncbi:hypothetical protein PR202_gb18273 [Eleusine coracana subsp. coracana]|uniref:DNA-directed RNA polymerase II subunit RPB9-like zinc ribbon domain-containing protein n=1 Tax=Eleusine coracana subsp. coracana TaxID=191504 RepID=A0AAV5F6Z5_ELECO|nr:hypothetical protein PR202_gb18273 [Eleusine coracana subsp. coracana]
MSTMKFCRECNNILYPKEQTDRRALLFACRNCEHQEISDNNCVYRNEVHHAAGERTQVLQDVASDPTLPRTKTVRCTECGYRKRRRGDDSVLRVLQLCLWPSVEGINNHFLPWSHR